jgi:hypothetical protein
MLAAVATGLLPTANAAQPGEGNAAAAAVTATSAGSASAIIAAAAAAALAANAADTVTAVATIATVLAATAGVDNKVTSTVVAATAADVSDTNAAATAIAEPAATATAVVAEAAAVTAADAASPLQRSESRNPRANSLAARGFEPMPVGFIPHKADCCRVPGWRNLGLGYPFFHPPIHVRRLREVAGAAAEQHFVLAADVEVEL